METDARVAAPPAGGLGEPEEPAKAMGRRRSCPSSPSRGPNAREAEAWVASASEAAVSTGAHARSSTDPASHRSVSFDPRFGEVPADFSGASRPSSPRSLLAGQRALFYAWDHLGTVRIVTEASCQVVDRKDYEPYGVEIRPATNSAGNTHQYTGHERDAASGLDYMHYRYHAANLGRFMKPDNVPGDLTTPQSWNLYAYVMGNPVKFNDPTGHMVGQAWRSYTWAGGDIAGTMLNHQQANGLGGGLNLGGHPFDDNPKGVIDWAIIDDVRRVPGSVVPHIELAPPTWTVTAGKSSLGDDWQRGTFDADIGSYLQREAIRLRGE
ncbi:MAG: RHS repeat-associated core domain-containing protein, partial [Acidobacteriota bacterium]